MKGLAQLFTEMGESYVELIANGMQAITDFGGPMRIRSILIHTVASSSFSGSGESMMIVEALVEVTSHPDDTIAEITFNFWYRLSCALTKRYNRLALV